MLNTWLATVQWSNTRIHLTNTYTYIAVSQDAISWSSLQEVTGNNTVVLDKLVIGYRNSTQLIQASTPYTYLSAANKRVIVSWTETSNTLYLSTDGGAWTSSQLSTPPSNIKALTTNGIVWIAADSSNTVYVSNDAMSWSPITMPSTTPPNTNAWTNFTWDGNSWFAVQAISTGVQIAYSGNAYATNWAYVTTQPPTNASISTSKVRMLYTGLMYVLYASNVLNTSPPSGPTYICSSIDGIIWGAWTNINATAINISPGYSIATKTPIPYMNIAKSTVNRGVTGVTGSTGPTGMTGFRGPIGATGAGNIVMYTTSTNNTYFINKTIPYTSLTPNQSFTLLYPSATLNVSSATATYSITANIVFKSPSVGTFTKFTIVRYNLAPGTYATKYGYTNLYNGNIIEISSSNGIGSYGIPQTSTAPAVNVMIGTVSTTPVFATTDNLALATSQHPVNTPVSMSANVIDTPGIGSYLYTILIYTDTTTSVTYGTSFNILLVNT